MLCGFHLKIDTGVSLLGLAISEVPLMLQSLYGWLANFDTGFQTLGLAPNNSACLDFVSPVPHREDTNNYDPSLPKTSEILMTVFSMKNVDTFPSLQTQGLLKTPFQALCKVHLFSGCWRSHKLRNVLGCHERFMFTTFIAADSNN